MGRSFRILEETGSYAKMTRFDNDLVKNNLLIGSGVTKCVDKLHGFEFILGLHHFPYMENKVNVNVLFILTVRADP